MPTSSRPTHSPPDSVSRRPGRPSRALPPPVAGLTVRFSLRSPALRWAAAVIVALGGRCTLVARVDAVPSSGTPAPAPPGAWTA